MKDKAVSTVRFNFYLSSLRATQIESSLQQRCYTSTRHVKPSSMDKDHNWGFQSGQAQPVILAYLTDHCHLEIKTAFLV